MNRGTLDVVSNISSGAGGNEYAELKPGIGEEYDVVECVGYHSDNTGARDTYWGITDGTTTVYRSTVTIADLLRQDFMSTVTGSSVIGNSVKGTGSITLKYGMWIRFYVNALAVGKKSYITAIVIKRRGAARIS